MNKTVKITSLPKMKLAYVSHKGDFSKIGNAYGMLMQWAGANGVLNQSNTKTVTIYHDDPKEVGMENVRQSACVTLNTLTEPGQGIGLRETTEGQFAVGHFEIDFTEFEQSWNLVFSELQIQGFQHTGEDCFEIYHNNFQEHPQKKCIVDICVPVK